MALLSTGISARSTSTCPVATGSMTLGEDRVYRLMLTSGRPLTKGAMSCGINLIVGTGILAKTALIEVKQRLTQQRQNAMRSHWVNHSPRKILESA